MPALDDINLTIESNEFIGIIGPSGSGKTTLVQHFTGLLQPAEGMVLIDGVGISHDKRTLDFIRKKVGIVFQFPEAQLFEETVYDDVAFAPRNFGLPEDKVEERLKDTFNLTGLDFEEMKTRSPFKLSEGEKRRIALAGIIAMNPEVLILDEPTACLDAAGIHLIEQLLTNLYALGKAIILVSHNLDFVAKLCKRIILMQEGKVCFDGSKEKFFKQKNTAKISTLDVPRSIRYSRKLYELGYVQAENLYSVDDIKVALDV